MENSDVALRIRYAASLDDKDTVRVIALGGQELDVETVAAWRNVKDSETHSSCRQKDLDALLAGLIIERRGPAPESVKPEPIKPAETSIKSAESSEHRDNNRILKQLRIAFKLRTDDVHDLVVLGGGRISKSETGALFRNPTARNYRQCGDQVLRWFLKGLGERERGQA